MSRICERKIKFKVDDSWAPELIGKTFSMGVDDKRKVGNLSVYRLPTGPGEPISIKALRNEGKDNEEGLDVYVTELN